MPSLRPFVSALRTAVRGAVLLPGDAKFAEEVATFNAAINHAPQVVVAAESSDDIAATVRLANEHGVKVHVHATGHGTFQPVTSGVLISTQRLKHLNVDPDKAVVTMGSGLQWRTVLDEAAKYDLTPIAGSSPTVGVAGYLLGGGIGPLVRSHGVSSDYVIGFKVVTGAGEEVVADARTNPDLFWALRGGSGKMGLGIVTEVTMRLVPMKTFYGGALFFDAQYMDKVLQDWVRWTINNPDPRVTSSLCSIRFPDFPQVPEVFRGRNLVSLRFAFPGSASEGATLAEPFRAIAPIHLDTLGELAAADIGKVTNDPPFAAPFWSGGVLLNPLDQRFASQFLKLMKDGAHDPFRAIEMRHLGGAASRDVPEGSAVAGRQASFSLSVVSRNPGLFDTACPQVAERMVTALGPWVSNAHNANFIGAWRADESLGSSWTTDALGKLQAVQQNSDPNGVLVAVKTEPVTTPKRALNSPGTRSAAPT